MSDERLRVAMIVFHTSPLEQAGVGDAGGMNVYVAETALALARRGVDVEIFTRRTRGDQPDVVPLVEPGSTPGQALVRHITAGPYEALDKAELPAQLCYFTAGVLRTAAEYPEGWYDVVHSHYWMSGHVGWLAADRWAAPLVHSMHTMARVKNDHLAPGDQPEPGSRIVGEEQVVSESDLLIASTASEADDLVLQYGADPRRIAIVPPGVDLQTFNPTRGRLAARRSLGLDPHRQLIVFAGRLQLLKGTDVLVRALRQLVDRRPADASEPAPQLVVLGGPSGHPQARDELRALAWHEGVSGLVELRDPVGREDLAQWFRAADVVAVPSRSESFGLVALEAQATGTPVVAAAVGGLTTAVDDGVSGLLVNGHDPARWADALERLLTNDEERVRLGLGARHQAERFTWSGTAELTARAYREARTRSGGHRRPALSRRRATSAY